MNTVIRDRQSRPVQLWIAWVFALLTVGYMLPWAIAVTRGKANAGAIGWLDFLLGWSLIGWIVALVMACSAHPVIGLSEGRFAQNTGDSTPNRDSFRQVDKI